MDSLIRIATITFILIVIYIIFLRASIMAWGASDDEVDMPLIGDDIALRIGATRAISIRAPVSEVWKWIVQLGADRGGFFSYSLIERLLGCEIKTPETVPGTQTMEVGRVIPGTIDGSKCIFKFNFQVVAVDPGKAFVLDGWGTFALREASPAQTRLIVRTHGRNLTGLFARIVDFFEVPLHYIMERRMMLGFKACAEGRGELPAAKDNLWLLAVLLSAIGLYLPVLVAGGLPGILLSVLCGALWLCILLVFEPLPRYALLLLAAEAAAVAAKSLWAGG